MWTSIAQTSGAKAYSMLVGVVILFFTARLLGPEGRGQIAAVTTWSALFATMAALSIGQAALYRLTNAKGDSEVARIVTLVTMLVALQSLVAVALAVFMAMASPVVFGGLSATVLIVGFLTIPLLIWDQSSSALLSGMGRLASYNKYLMIGRTASLIFLIIFAAIFPFGVTGVLFAIFIGQLIVTVGGVKSFGVYFIRPFSGAGAGHLSVGPLLLDGLKLHANAIGTFCFTSANILILNYYHGAAASGYFQLATQLLAVVMTIPHAASLYLYGRVASLGPNQAWPINRRLLIQILIGVAGLAAVAAASAPWVISLLAGPDFTPAVTPFQVMTLGLFGMAMSEVMAPQWISRGYFWQAAALTMAVGASSLGIAFLFIPSNGIYGAVYAFLTTFLISIAGNGLMAAHCQRKYLSSLVDGTAT